MFKPLVTVIMPSLNVKAYIKPCIDSVIGQSLHELEILCIDAGSTDGTLEILREYALLDERVKIISSSVKSYGRQVNMGISLAKGKYVAVVETDDYIGSSMYEKLYTLAEDYQLDFVKADFMGFRMLHNGKPYYDQGRVWVNDELYGKVISVKDYPQLYVRDVNIWKGLYNKRFLAAHKIMLNETPGAAFQDIGFGHMLLLYAKRGMYIRNIFYFYRRDSAGSSSVQPYGLCYAYQEYKRLHDFANRGLSVALEDAQLFNHYLYVRMVYVFIGEYEKILYCNAEGKKEFREATDWFREALGRAIGKKEITVGDVGEEAWEKLGLLLSDEKAYDAKWHESQEKKERTEKKLLNEIGNGEIVVFGCGHNGERCLLFCDKYNVNIAAFSDNNHDLWGKQYYGYDICNPAVLNIKYSGIKVMISTLKYEKDIRNQLIKFGVCEEQIILFAVGL